MVILFRCFSIFLKYRKFSSRDLIYDFILEYKILIKKFFNKYGYEDDNIYNLRINK